MLYVGLFTTINEKMPAKLPSPLKSQVIQKWLEGQPRNDIAAENGLSSGAVTNIVNEWKRSLGFALADELRELALAIKKTGMTTSQCALGLRVASIIQKIGVNENSLETFITEVYNRCKDLGLSPENISSHMEDLLDFSRGAVVRLPNMADYIEEKTDQKKKLEEEIGKLKSQKEILLEEKRDVESSRDTTLQQARMTTSELNWYRDLKAELKKYSIPIEDISKFAKIVHNLRGYGYDGEKVLEEFAELQFLRSNIPLLRKTGQSFERSIDNLKQQESALQALVNMHNLTISTYQHLEVLGFGLKELDYLRNMITEIGLANGIPVEHALKKFLRDLEEQYHKKLGFESKVESLRVEVEKLNQQQSRLRAELLLLPLIGPKLVKLTQSGVSEQDIINISAVFEKYIAEVDRQSFVTELEKYGGLKSTLQKLSDQASKLRTEQDLLQTQKEELNKDVQTMLSSLVESRRTFDFLNGLSFSSRNNILSLISTVTCLVYLRNLQFEYLQNMKTDQFESLSRAYNGEQGVSTKDVMRDLIKAIEFMQNKPDLNEKLREALSNVRVTLSGVINT